MTDKAFGQPMTKHKTPSKVAIVKLEYEDRPRRILATHAVEEHGRGSLIVYDDKTLWGGSQTVLEIGGAKKPKPHKLRA